MEKTGLIGMQDSALFTKTYQRFLNAGEDVLLQREGDYQKAVILFVDATHLNNPRQTLETLKMLSIQQRIYVLSHQPSLLEHYCDVLYLSKKVVIRQCLLLGMCCLLFFSLMGTLIFQHNLNLYYRSLTIPHAIGVKIKGNLQVRCEDKLFTGNRHYRLLGLSYNKDHYQYSESLFIYDKMHQAETLLYGRQPRNAHEIVLPENTAKKLSISKDHFRYLMIYYAKGHKVRGTLVHVVGISPKTKQDLFYSLPDAELTYLSEAFHKKVHANYGVIYTKQKLSKAIRYYRHHYPKCSFQDLSRSSSSRFLNPFVVCLMILWIFFSAATFYYSRECSFSRALTRLCGAYGMTLLLFCFVMHKLNAIVMADSINQSLHIKIPMLPLSISYLIILVFTLLIKYVKY